MTQELFDCCALTVAFAGFHEKDMIEISRHLAAEYSDAYGDLDVAQQLFEAGDLIVKNLPKLMEGDYSESQLSAACKTLQKAIMKFNLDGSKKRRRLLGGTRFMYEKLEISNKIENCVSNIALYHFSIIGGVIDHRKLK